jgi:hypothetical protein
MEKIKNVCALFALMLFMACTEEGPEITGNDPKDEMAVTLGMGEFIDLNAGHHLSGTVLILADDKNQKTLRFEDLSVVNGPDVNVYLSKTPMYKDVIDLGDLKATKGSVNYALDPSINTSEHKYVLIWCVEYAVLFGYAEIIDN